MNLDDMIDAIEATSKINVWLLVEAEMNAVSRFKLRHTFFQALKELGEPMDLPIDKKDE